MSEVPKPILISGEIAFDLKQQHGIPYDEYPTDIYDPLLSELREAEESQNGIASAVRLLLTEAAVAIYFVNMDESSQSVRSQDVIPVYKKHIQLGFNDHGCGSESAYKILINRYSHGDVKQYVLVSPADEDGNPTNMAFHNASFSFPTNEPRGLEYASRLPNSLKTGGNTHHYGRRDYQFLLFGGSEVPSEFGDTFLKLGFSFAEEPYDFDLHANLWQPIDPKDRHSWPGSQFAAQIALLDLVTN